MHRILLLGAGKIGRMITKLLVESGDYDVLVADYEQAALARIKKQSQVATAQGDATKREELQTVLAGRDSVVSALSFRFNPLIAEIAVAAGINYFDLTEDIETTRKVREIVERASPKSIVCDHCVASNCWVTTLSPIIKMDSGSSTATPSTAPARASQGTMSGSTPH